MKASNNKFKIVLTSVALSAVISSSAFAEFLNNKLNNISVEQLATDKIVINVKTEKKYSTPLNIYEKGKNSYFVSFPSTTYSGDKNIDVSDVDNAVKDITVEYIPYASDKNSGYTKMTINMKAPIKPELNQTAEPSKIIFFALIFACLGLVSSIGYGIFRFIYKYNKKRKGNDILENMDTTTDIRNDKLSDLLAAIYKEDLNEKYSDENSSDFSLDENYIDEYSDSMGKNLEMVEENIEQKTEDENELIEQKNAEKSETEKNTTNDFVEENIEIAEENPESIEAESKLTEQEIVNETIEPENTFAEYHDEIAEENNKINIQTDDQADSYIENSIFPDADEVVSDILTNEDVIDKISETVIENIAEEDEIISEHLEDDNYDNFVDIEPNEISDDDFNDEPASQNDIIDTSIEEENDDYEDFTEIVEEEQNENEEIYDITLHNDDYKPNNVSDFSSVALPKTSSGSEFTPKTTELNFTKEDNTSKETPRNSGENASESNYMQFSAFSFDGVIGEMPSQEDLEELKEKLQIADDNSVSENEVLELEISEDNLLLDDFIEQVDLHEDNKIPYMMEKNLEINTIENVDDEVLEFIEEDVYNISETDKGDSEIVKLNTEEIEEVNKESIQENAIDFKSWKFELPKEFAVEQQITEEQEIPNEQINTENFFEDNEFIETTSNEFFKQDDIQEINDVSSFFKDESDKNIVEIDDSEPIVLSQIEIEQGKQLYLLKHIGKYSLVGIANDNVFILNKFNSAPNKNNIVLKYNEKRNNKNIYIAKVGTWRALIAVSDNTMENILTL